MTTNPDGSSGSGAGRPRDPDLDRRIFDAALGVYSELGWKGFSVVAVSKRSGVARASIYLRWPNSTDLLIDAVKSRVSVVEHREFDDVRSELLSLTRQLLKLYVADAGRTSLRLMLEAHLVPGLKELWEDVASSQVLAARAVVTRAIARGELPPETSVTLILETLCGAAMIHGRAAPDHLRGHQLAKLDDYAEQLVDFVLTAARMEAVASE